MRYLQRLSNPNTVEEFNQFTTLIAQIEKEGVKVIWDNIKNEITDHMYKKYGEFYQTDQPLIKLIETGREQTLPDLESLKQFIKESEGYRKFCDHTLRQPYALFPLMKPNKKNLIERRHESGAAQHRYDQRFGLITTIRH